MEQHKLLTRQLKKYGNEAWLQDEPLKKFLETVNESYQAYDRDKELSEHAFLVSQEEFSDINKQLKEEVLLRKLSIEKLLQTISNLSKRNNAVFDGSEDDLLGILDYLNTEIARRKEAEQQMQTAKEEAEKASKAKTEFLSIMSHEIRTPLNAVIGMGHMLLKSNPRPDQLDNLKVLKSSADNLLVLINDILDFNKIEADKLELEASEFNIKTALQDLVAAQAHYANERGNKVALVIDDAIPDFVIGDPLRMAQVLNNLISNAVKFTQMGNVTVKLDLLSQTADNAVMKFAVEDTGVGIDAATLPNLFQPFMQASTAITRQFGGTGLGLVITRRLLHLMGSDIEVESVLGKGSVFSFSVSLKKADQNDGQIHIHAGLDYDLQNKSILLVEDTLFNVMFATQLLEDWKAKVAVAENGAVAVEMMQNNHYDLVLMDLQMPVMDGFTATREIRKFNSVVPIVALTASATSNVREKVLEAGMQDYVTKPFNPDDFFMRLKKLLA